MQIRNILMGLLGIVLVVMLLIPESRAAIADTPIADPLSIPLPVYGLLTLALLYYIRNWDYYIYVLSGAFFIASYLIYAQVAVYNQVCLLCIIANVLFIGLWLVEISTRTGVKG